MAVDTTIQRIQENPEIEAYRIGLLQDVTDFIRENAQLAPDAPVMPPAFQVAGLDPMPAPINLPTGACVLRTGQTRIMPVVL